MTSVRQYWKQYLNSLPAGVERRPSLAGSFSFGTNPTSAADIARLVVDGTKTATGSLLWTYEAGQRELPKRGDLWVVTHGGDDPVCIVETTAVEVLPYDEVSEAYARAGGEGDRSLASWRRIYWQYIEHECERIGRGPSEQTPLVMERFRVVYREPLHDRGSDAQQSPP